MRMNAGKRFRTFAVSVGAISAVVAGAAPAQADVDQCASRQACVWQNDSYGWSFRGMTADANDYNNIVWTAGILYGTAITRTKVSSVRNEGVNCYVRFWSGPNHTGDNLDFRRLADGNTYTDPDLTNGGGLSTSPDYRKNFNDRVASHYFFNC
ncbi:MAG: peptidase inhibitor family I36 protein [Phycicoccus sp.]